MTDLNLLAAHPGGSQANIKPKHKMNWKIGKQIENGRADIVREDLTAANVTKARKREGNLSGLLDRLLADWLKSSR